MDSHTQTYQQARYYDIAFSFRDLPAECEALCTWAMRHGLGPVGAILELAAGPARHAREFARRGVQAMALDSSEAMSAYARNAARAEGLDLEVVTADMTDFTLAQPVDLAVLPMDSVSYLLDNDAVLAHLAAVARHLRPGGLYVLEMCHPRDIFRVGAASTQTTWTQRDVSQDTVVETTWGMPDDPFDPITQIDEVSVTMRWSGPDGAGEVRERARQRRFTALEIDALVRASGCFDIVARHGAMDAAQPFDNSRAAWRMVLVLRRRDLA
jgi:SAM-dependent methyltransferase